MAQTPEDILKQYVANLVVENAVLKSQLDTANEELAELKKANEMKEQAAKAA